MRYYLPLLTLICLLCIQTTIWADSCQMCYEKIAEGKVLCSSCRKQYPDYNTQTREKELIESVIQSRKSHRKILWQLTQFYNAIGNLTRLKAAEEELDHFNSAPQPLYSILIADEEKAMLNEDVAEANASFETAKALKDTFDLINKKSKQIEALKIFGRIISTYPESDKADDAAFEIAEIYSGFLFREYEWAAEYYEKSHRWNPDSGRSALYLAAKIYDEKLSDYSKAARLYEEAAETSPNIKHRKHAKKRAEELKNLGY